MKKEEREKKEKEARGLFANGMAMDRISKEIEVSDRTLTRWRKKYKWDDFKKEVDKKVSENLLETVSEMKERHIKIVKVSLGKFLENLKKDKIKVSASEAAKMLQHELDLRIPKTVSQYNFIKQENLLMEPRYTFEIISPNDRRNKRESKN